MTASNKLGRKELLDEILRLADEIGTTPSTSDMNEHGQYSISPYYRVFGSWSAALQTAGFEAPPAPEERSTSELLAELHRLADGDDPPSQPELNANGAYAPETYRRHFGSWTTALREAGFSPPTSGTRIPDAELCDALVSLAEKIEDTPTTTDIDERGPYSSGTYINRFGSWQDALTAAGLESDDGTHSPTTEMLVTAIQELASDLDRPPLAREMNDSGPYHSITYYRRFGSWSDALEEADIEREPTPPGNKLNRETLLAELRRLATEQEGESPPTTKMMQQDGQYSPGTYINRFGSWEAALAAADLVANQ